jgi:hypothetical protein
VTGGSQGIGAGGFPPTPEFTGDLEEMSLLAARSRRRRWPSTRDDPQPGRSGRSRRALRERHVYGLRHRIILGETPMSRSQTRDSMRSASMLALQDLDARLAPLDRYGLPGVSAAIVEGLHALFVVSMSAARLCRCCSRRRRGWSGSVGGAPALLRIRGCLRLLARQSAEQPGQSRSSNWLRLKHESSDEQQDCILRAPQQASFAQCGIWRTAPDKDASGPAARPARAANRNGASTVVKGVRQRWLQRIE